MVSNGQTKCFWKYLVDEYKINVTVFETFVLFWFLLLIFYNVKMDVSIIMRRGGRKGSNYDDLYIMKVYFGTNDNDNEKKKTRMAKNIIIENRLPSWLPNYGLLRE